MAGGLALALALLAAGWRWPRLLPVVAALALAGWAGLALGARTPGLGMVTVAAGVAAAILGYRGLLRSARRRAQPLPGGGPGAGHGSLPAQGPLPADEPPPAETGPGSAGDDPLERYARHIVLREIGGPGQARLRAARVLIVGAGGLGAPACLYLAAAGVGRITVADDDTVDLSNLQRQVIFRTADRGRPKAEAAASAMAALNPHVAVTALARRIGPGDAALVAGHDLVLDGSDSFASRDVVNRLCVAAGRPLLAGAIGQWEGQVALYPAGGPCLACLFPTAPAAGLAPACAEAGVAGPLPGVIGSLMALEAVKHLAGAGETLAGRMLIYDGLAAEARTITLRRDPDCPVCGPREESAA